MTTKTIFTSWRPDPVGMILGTGFMQFTAPHGICGLAKIEGESLHILAIESMHEGRGNCRAFIASAKQAYREIIIWEVLNARFKDALRRYAFYFEKGRLDSCGERADAYVWSDGRNCHSED